MRTIEQIKRRMRLLGISQSEMAIRIGVTETTMSRWFNNERRPTINYIEAMAREMDCELILAEKYR